MFKILLLLALASCAKLNLKVQDKSGKKSESKPAGPVGVRSWSETRSLLAIHRPNDSHSSQEFKSSKGNGKK